jgi:hypothetical protein
MTALTILMVLVTGILPTLCFAQETTNPSVLEIAALTNRMISLNSQFPDPNLIEIGEEVIVPGNDGKYYHYTARLQDVGHDCLWHIARRYLSGELPARIVHPTPAPESALTVTRAPEPAPEPKVVPWYTQYWNNFKRNSARLWWVLVIIAITLIGLITWKLMSWYYNPDRHPPVREGGLSEDPAEALAQINAITPESTTRRRVKATKGTLVHTSGLFSFSWPFLLMRMAFGDGISRKRLFLSGETCYFVEFENENGEKFFEIWRGFCANAGTLRSIPRGWNFVPADPNEDATQASTEATAIETTPATEVAPEIVALPAQEEATQASTEAVTPVPVPTCSCDHRNPAPQATRTVTLEIKNGGSPIVIKAEGTDGDMPTKVEYTPDGGVTVLFPRDIQPRT